MAVVSGVGASALLPVGSWPSETILQGWCKFDARQESESGDGGDSTVEENDFLVDTEDAEDASMEDVESSSDNEVGAIDVE
ncbi:unnamed protein product [Prorocentrum cordatum]|uniref:Uncharacterized protein n=1 Tax=Prorocentrum cordatum TaxID=2364126 RepID=A0ABN9WMC6_9DINO|nr:unnamed protein product [Polarella glacialis]